MVGKNSGGKLNQMDSVLSDRKTVELRKNLHILASIAEKTAQELKSGNISQDLYGRLITIENYLFVASQKAGFLDSMKSKNIVASIKNLIHRITST
jgi:hypothetical protein